jgi:polyisoprenoid-binding protein YceI
MQTATQRSVVHVEYKIDTAASRFTVQAFSIGILSSFGHNPMIGIRDFDGHVRFDPVTYAEFFLQIRLRVTPLEILDEMKGDDRKKIEQLMYQEVLEVDRFPDAIFESNQVSAQSTGEDSLLARVSGELVFHGVKRPQSLDARVTKMGAMLRVSGEFSLRQSDYEIKPFSYAGGALRLKDELKFKFELLARKQE